MSIKRVAHSIPINMWIPATEKAALDFSSALLRIFRDEGARGDRQKARLMFLIEEYGVEAFRARLVKEMVSTAAQARTSSPPKFAQARPSSPSTSTPTTPPRPPLLLSTHQGGSVAFDDEQPEETTPYERRETLGVHSQPQPGLSRVGIHIPAGRLSPAECRDIADLADKYSESEVRSPCLAHHRASPWQRIPLAAQSPGSALP